MTKVSLTITSTFVGVLILLVSPIAARAASGISVSPANLDYQTEANQNITEELKITNNTDKSQAFEFSVISVLKTSDNNIYQEAKLADDLAKVTVDTSTVTLAPGKSKIVKVKINLQEKILDADNLPAILIKVISTSGRDIVINQRIIIPILPSFSKKVDYDLAIGLTTKPNQTVTYNSFDIEGYVNNRQNRYIQVSGILNVVDTANQKILGSYSVTDDFNPEGITKDQLATFNKKVTVNSLVPFQSYKLELQVTDIKTGQIFLTSIDFRYVPIDLILISMLILLALVIILLSYFTYQKLIAIKAKRNY